MTQSPLHDLAKRYLDKDAIDLESEERRVLTQSTNQKSVSRDAADVADERSTFEGGASQIASPH